MFEPQFNTQCIHQRINGLCVGNSMEIEFQCVLLSVQRVNSLLMNTYTVFTQCAHSRLRVKRFSFKLQLYVLSYMRYRSRSTHSRLRWSEMGSYTVEKIVRKKF